MDLTRPCPGFCGGSMMTCTCPDGNWYLDQTAGADCCPGACGRSRRMCTCPSSKYEAKLATAVNGLSVALAAENSGAWRPSLKSELLLDQLMQRLKDAGRGGDAG